MTMKNYFKANIALELPSAVTLGAACHGPGTSKHFYFNHVRDRQRGPNTGDPARLPGHNHREKARDFMGVVVRQKIKGKGLPWWVFVAYQGKRTSKLVGDKKAADEVASTIRAKLRLGEFSFEEEKPVKTFKEYAYSWIKTTIPATCKESTGREYKDILKNHIESVFSDQKINRITRGHVKTFLLEKLNGGYARSTVVHMRKCLSGVFNVAVDDEVIPANPAQGLGKFLKPKDRKEDINPLTPEELTKLLDTVQEHFPEHYTLFLLLARTGMRIGEALALQWGDIDFNSRFIEVRRSVVREKITTPKNGKSRRVDMSMQLMDALKIHRTGSKKRGLELGLGELPEYIFINQNGGMLYKDNWRRRVFKKALEKAELRTVRIHDMRHTYATLRISKGDNIADVSKQLGHYSIKLTLDTYTHLLPGKKKGEVDGLDDPVFFTHPDTPYTHPETKKGLAVIS